jgi:GAF domain
VADCVQIHLQDVQAEVAEYPEGVALARRVGARTILATPLMREGEAIGAMMIRRDEVRPFTDKQIALLQTFADQAVIAIENTRLFEELQARTRELQESLEYQTATSDVLGVISSSPGELQPVFEALHANAVRLCGAKFGTLTLYDGNTFRNVALHNVPPAYAPLREPFRPHPKAGLAHVASTKQVVQTDDLRTKPPYLEGDPAVVAIADLAGARTIINVPMLKDGSSLETRYVMLEPLQPQRRRDSRGCGCGLRAWRLHGGDRGERSSRRRGPGNKCRRPACDRRYSGSMPRPR